MNDMPFLGRLSTAGITQLLFGVIFHLRLHRALSSSAIDTAKQFRGYVPDAQLQI